VSGSPGSQQYPHNIATYTGPKGSQVDYLGQNDPLGTGRNTGQANDIHYQNEQLAAIRKANEDAANNLIRSPLNLALTSTPRSTAPIRVTLSYRP
jgi:hypothetical protein